MTRETAKSTQELVFEALKSFISTYRNPLLMELNLENGLEIIRESYDADIALILSMDVDTGVLGVIEIVQREDVNGLSKLLTERRIGQNLFREMLLPGEYADFSAIELKEDHPTEYDWMLQNGMDNISLSPIRTRADFVGFFGVINARRMVREPYVLTMATGMLQGEVRAFLISGATINEKHRSLILEDNDVVINMFGGFDIRTNLGRMRYIDFSSSQCCLMLIYLLLHRNRTVSVREIAEILWPDQLFDNPYNMIKSVAFRLRKLLSPISNQNIVVANHGTYAINEALHIIIDVDSFSKICDMLTKPYITEEEKLVLYKNLINVYRGDFLPSFESEIWLLGKINYYQMRYWGALKDYLRLLETTGRFEEFFYVASNAMNATYADSDIYYYIISVLMKQNKLEMARSSYLKVEKMLTAEQRKTFMKLWNTKMSEK